VLFSALVLLSSFLTTFFMIPVDEPSYYYQFNLFDLLRDLVRAAFRILQDEGHFFDSPFFGEPSRSPPSLFSTFVRRFILGLPVVGAASLVHMLLSLPFFGPLHWLARYRSSRDRRANSSRDFAAIFIIILIAVGVARQVPSSTTPCPRASRPCIHNIGQYTKCTS
jgi:hypothetical protein